MTNPKDYQIDSYHIGFGSAYKITHIPTGLFETTYAYNKLPEIWDKLGTRVDEYEQPIDS